MSSVANPLRFVARLVIISIFSLALSGTCDAGIITLVNKTFNGYLTSNDGAGFPDEKPDGDPVNFGVPLTSEGADSPLWLAARFELFDDNPIPTDVGVQKAGGGVMDLDDGTANSWYRNHWTELLRASAHTSFQHASYPLPGGETLYLAFWMDNGNKDFAKFDNIVIMADREVIIPEPSSLALCGLGAALVAAMIRARSRALQTR